MKLVKWEELPEEMKTPQVRKYYEILKKKRVSLAAKRGFDIAASSAMLIMLSPVFAALAVAIKADSEGPVFFRQERVTQYGRRFRIFKFRTMVNNADKLGTQVTVGNDKVRGIYLRERGCLILRNRSGIKAHVYLLDLDLIGVSVS